MPQPIVFQRAPLVRAQALPLNPGQVLLTEESGRLLFSRVPAEIPPCCLEGFVRLAACVSDPEIDTRADAAVHAALKDQREDGALPGTPAEALAAVRAAWFRAMASGDRALFAAVSRWLGWAGAHYDELIAAPEIRRHPADLAELLVMHYRQLGTQGALRLLAKLRRDADDWASRLGGFSVDRPADAEQLERALAEASDADRPYWENLAELSSPVCLAEGLRAAHCLSVYSGNRSEAEAGERVWSRLQRWHGAACGGVTGVGFLQGRSPAARIDPAAVGAWLEALAPCAADGADWAAEGLERLLTDALPAVIARGAFAVNQTGGAAAPISDRALGMLLRGCAAAAHAAVAAEPEGFAVRFCLPGACGLRVGDVRVRLRITREADGMAVALHPDRGVKLRLTVRVPDWLTGASVRLNGAVCGQIADGRCVLEQTFTDGDRVTVTGEPALRIESGYHQSRTVRLGPALLALPAAEDEAFAYALVSAERGEDGQVTAVLTPVEGWRRKDGRPADVPVLPARAGEDVRRTLVPFAQAASGMAVFAGVRA